MSSDSFCVLDCGFLELIDYMGCECAVAQAARVSYMCDDRYVAHNFRDCAGIKKVDVKLLEYLVIHGHWSPFEACVMKFHIKAPLFVIKHIVRHRTGSFNEVSMRYSNAEKSDFYFPRKEDVKIGVSKSDKQSAVEHASDSVSSEFLCSLMSNSRRCMELYENSVNNMNIAKEQSRMLLPQNLFSRIYMTINLRNLLHLIHLRLGKGAQPETREYAGALLNIVNDKYPNIARIFDNHILRAKKLSGDAVEFVLSNEKIISVLKEEVSCVEDCSIKEQLKNLIEGVSV